MEKNNVKQTVRFIFLCIAFIALSSSLFSQDGLNDFSLEVKGVTSKKAADGEITILVNNSSTAPYIYKIFDKEPWNGGSEQYSSISLYESSYTFSNISKGDYLVCIIDSENNTSCKKVEVSTR
ncbi:MAG: hypothetical protein JXA77_00620 [Bacteroidales bacterium]|nr:hypothetical protein [Bacteroidales bacterium]MBN2820829.1 hypothetical protein [Bacteroidales bacterium]